MATTVRTVDPGDEEALLAAGRMSGRAFIGRGYEPDAAWLARNRHGRRLVAAVDGHDAATLAIRPYGQLFGGRRVPMGGIASVAVDPWARGRGAALAVLDAALRHLHEDGQPVSALYPTVPPLYRSAGWERAGEIVDVVVPPATLQPRRRPADVGLRPVDDASLPEVHALYRAVADAQDGMLDREGPLFDPRGLLALDHAAMSPGRAYVTATRSGADLEVHDLVALDAEAADAVLALLASWAGLVARLRVRLTEPTLLGLHAPPSFAGDVGSTPWWLRVVDLPSAVAARGWPTAPLLREGAVDLDLDDPAAPWHAGRWRLSVEGGAVRCERGGAGSVRLGPRGLAAWFAGAAGTPALRRAGLLEGEAPLLDALLPGGRGTPRMADHF